MNRHVGKCIKMILIDLLALLLLLASVTSCGLLLSAFQGENTIEKNAVIAGTTLDGGDFDQSVVYHRKEYAYKQGMINILLLGTDAPKGVTEETVAGQMGQSDAIYLLSIDTYNHQVIMYGIPRDTMVPVQIYDENNQFVNSITFELCTQYAFGTNVNSATELTAKAVSSLLYYIPINRVAVINTQAISVLNDAIGGVTVTFYDEFTDETGEVLDEAFYKGNTVKLNGEQARMFVQERDCTKFASAMDRATRQEQYIQKFISTFKSEMKKNLLLPFQMFQELENADCFYTNLTTQEIIYLLGELYDYDLEQIERKTIPGKTVMGSEFEEYRVDYDQLKALIIEDFYTQLD